ncbi:MAG: HIT family protein [Acidimicrobiales bacterium]
MACVFCDIVTGRAEAHRVADEAGVVAFLDARPLFPGHVLVVPRAHHETLADLPAPLVGPLFGAVQRLAIAVPAAMGADGSFVAMNNTVSQSVAHLHVHVVPRRRGDGLRGFFWPRGSYGGPAEMAEVAARIAGAMAPGGTEWRGTPLSGTMAPIARPEGDPS